MYTDPDGFVIERNGQTGLLGGDQDDDDGGGCGA